MLLNVNNDFPPFGVIQISKDPEIQGFVVK